MVTWPVEVAVVRPDGTAITLRGLRRADREAWERVRRTNRDWLSPWESSVPGVVDEATSFHRMRRGFDRAARQGRVVPFVIEADGQLVGQMHLFEIAWAWRRNAAAGYWLAREATGRGIATWALAMLIDHGLTVTGLHRVEVNIRPENVTSLAVVRRLGLREEGLHPRLIHVDGAWRDHLQFAVTAEELPPGGLVGRLG